MPSISWNESPTPIDGVWFAVYDVQGGMIGSATFILSNGTIIGVDALGGCGEGTYHDTDAPSHIAIDMRWDQTYSQRLERIAGRESSGPPSFTICSRIPRDFGAGHPIDMHTSVGSLNVVFRRVRDLPR
jgi:hypothetical protein